MEVFGWIISAILCLLLFYIGIGCLMAFDFWLKVNFQSESSPPLVNVDFKTGDYIAMIFLWGSVIFSRQKSDGQDD